MWGWSVLIRRVREYKLICSWRVGGLRAQKRLACTLQLALHCTALQALSPVQLVQPQVLVNAQQEQGV